MGLQRPRWLRVWGMAECRLGEACRGEACLPVHQNLHLSGARLLCQRLRQLRGQKVAPDYASELFRERMRDLFVAGPFDRRCVRIIRMEGKSATWRGFNVEVELEFLTARRKI